MDPATKKQLALGYRLTELLKQKQYQPLPVERQVVQIYSAVNGLMDDVEVESVQVFSAGLLDDVTKFAPQVYEKIVKDRDFDEAWEASLKKAAADYKSTADQNWFIPAAK